MGFGEIVVCDVSIGEASNCSETFGKPERVSNGRTIAQQQYRQLLLEHDIEDFTGKPISIR